MMTNSLPGNWSWVTLEDIAAEDYGLVDGPFGSNLPASDYVSFGIPVIRGSNLTLGDGFFKSDEFVFVSDETAHRLSRSLCHPEDIIFTKKGTLGQTGFVPHDPRFEKYLISSNQMKLTVDRAVANPLFVYYYVSSPQSRQKVKRDSEATGVPKTNLEYLRTFPVPLPPLEEQHAIAHILGSLDDKIELNRRMNATLEAMARAIFRSWFVDFDPVHAKARGEQPSGMDAATAALFPDSFEESELGILPYGWKVEPIGKYVKAKKGLSYKGEGLADEGVPMHNLNSVYEGGGYKYEGIKFYTGDYQDRHLIKPGDVIVTNTEQGFEFLLIGYAAIVPKRFGEEGLFSHHIYCVKPKQSSYLTSNFLYHLFVSPRFHRVIAGYSNGTTVNMLPADALEKPLFVVPPQALIKAFEGIVQPMREKAELNYDETVTLAELRDALLPRLISGELRVGDLEDAASL